MKIRDVFLTDPTTRSIPNDGVAKVVQPSTDEQWDVVRYELQNFVCEGEYKKGLERILGSYLGSLHLETQPAAWVSGFYGSGKSHLVRILEFLWADTNLPGGASARGLANLPDSVKEFLTELTTEGRRNGGLWSAAGSLAGSSGDNPRLALLSIVFRSAGLPDRYNLARFVLWLQGQGYLDAVKQNLATSGRTLEKELPNLYVSPFLAKALVGVQPDLGDEKGAREMLRQQFPSGVTDVTDDEMVETIDAVLEMKSTAPGKRPLTLIILDELQQFLQDSAVRTNQTANLVEMCSSRFGSRLLFVATGQAALQSTPQLQRMVGRFTVRVHLSDTDVEKVVRQVVLRKDPKHVPDVKTVLETHSGEVDRQLNGTKAAPQDADSHTLVADYPLLPSRRRFWDFVLKAVDKPGISGQLRTQLRVVHEAVRDIARQDVGHVVPGDFIYDQLSTELLQNGILLREIHENIERQAEKKDNGTLRSRIGKMVFLLNQISATGGTSGLSATATYIADLLVEDLTKPSEGLRQEVIRLLDQMADDGMLLKLGNEYRLQTHESAQWENSYKQNYLGILKDESKVATTRGDVFKAAIEANLKSMGLTQGDTKTPRKSFLHFGQDMPSTESGQVPIWVRDEWSVTHDTVKQDARTAGQTSAVVHLFLPKAKAGDIKEALSSWLAAQETLNAQSIPATPDGIDAKKGMETRRDTGKKRLDEIVTAVLEDAKVYLGGGSEKGGIDIRTRIQDAAQDAVARLFDRFKPADNPKWETVWKQTMQGSGDPLKILGHNGEADTEPVCKAILEYVGAGTKGIDIRKHFEAPPFGWPKDAIDGATAALVASGHLLARQANESLTARQLDHSKFGSVDFRAQTVVLKIEDKFGIRKVLQDAKVPYTKEQEAAAVPLYVEHLRNLARDAGGAAPLPEVPSPAYLHELESLSGNELILAALKHKDAIVKDVSDWTERAKRRTEREPRWDVLDRLLTHAGSLKAAATVRPQVEAVCQNRSLLDDTDPLPPLVQTLTEALRTELTTRYDATKAAFDDAIENLKGSPDWFRLDDQLQQQVIQTAELVPVAKPDVKSTDSILKALDARDLEGWANLKDAIAGRLNKAYAEMARLLEPEARVLHLPKATLKTAQDVDAYISGLKKTLLDEVQAGPVTLQ